MSLEHVLLTLHMGSDNHRVHGADRHGHRRECGAGLVGNKPKYPIK